MSPDALALVRFGLRRADDPRIRNTVRVIDHLLKVDLPQGPLWRRYNEDGYGEKSDGRPFNGSGIGRAWPLLAAERAHYELAFGDSKTAFELLDTLEASTSPGGLIPEQIWDSEDLPEHELVLGRPSGSAMPLVWAHAEHVKLLRSLRDGRVFDMPAVVAARYANGAVDSDLAIWRFATAPTELPPGKRLRIETLAPTRVHWSTDGWATTQDVASRQTSFDISVTDLPTGALSSGSTLVFTFFWPEAGHWEGRDFAVTFQAAPTS